VSRCEYCGGPLDRIDVSSFGGERRIAYGYCEARCTPPRCVSCDHNLTPDRRCENLDCPVAFVTQPLPTEATS
jgi:hypothetical protein